MSESNSGSDEACAMAWQTAFEKQSEYCGTGEMMVQAEQLLGVDASGADFDDILDKGLTEPICTAPTQVERRMWVLARVFWAGQSGEPLIEAHDHDVREAINAGLREADSVCSDLVTSGDEIADEVAVESE